MKIKTFIVILISYSLVFAGFYTFLKTSQLKEPLFLTHYYQKEVFDSSDIHISLYYLTNRGDDIQLVSVQSKEFPDKMLFVDYDTIQFSEGIYNQHEATITIQNREKNEVSFEDLVFAFSDGTVVETDIGAIQLIEAQRREEEPLIDQLAAGSTNGGESYSAGKVIENSILTELSIPYPQELSELVDLKLNNSRTSYKPETIGAEELKLNGKNSTEELPLRLKAGQLLRVNAFMDENEMYKNDIHAIEIGVTGTFELDGKEMKQHLMYITEHPYLTSKEIKKLKKMREEGKR